jgi:hypothetical protein
MAEQLFAAAMAAAGEQLQRAATASAAWRVSIIAPATAPVAQRGR